MGQWQEDLAIQYKDFPGVDAFGHIRVSNPETLVSVLGQYDTEPLEMETGATGAGIAPAHDTNLRMARLAANAGTGTSFSQSYVYWTYQPGRSQRVEVAGKFSTGVAGAIVDFGYFDSANGIMYRQNGASGVAFVIRTSTSGSVVDQVVPQASWNLDKLDGTGAPGIVLDTTKVFIITMDLEFQGMGRVRMGFNLDGKVVYAHEFLHANRVTTPYMQTATLPLHALLTATGTVAPSEAFFKGGLIISEGGLLKERGFTFSTPERTVTAANGARTHLLSVRPKLLFNGIVNRESYVTRSLEIFVDSPNPIYWELVAGANFSVAPTWTDVNTQFSGTEISTGGVFSSLTGGVVLQSGYMQPNTKDSSGSQSISINLHHPLTLNRAGAHTAIGILSLLVTGIGGTAATRASFNFTELR
jgi:hypothetical protein